MAVFEGLTANEFEMVLAYRKGGLAALVALLGPPGDVLDLLAERAVDPDLAVCDEVWTRCTATATHSEIEQIVEMYLACVALYAPKDGTR